MPVWNKNKSRPNVIPMVVACISVVLFAISCQGTHNTPTFSPPSAAPHVEITVLLAELKGKLELVDGCPRVYREATRESIALAWDPNLIPKVEADKIIVTIGNTHTVVLYFGDMVDLMGGEPPLDAATLRTFPANCKGPYFSVGGIVERSQPTGSKTTTVQTTLETPTP